MVREGSCESSIAAMTDRWVHELATSPLVGTRRRLLKEVIACCEPSKERWLRLLARDSDPHVMQAAAAELSAHLLAQDQADEISRLEDAFTEGVLRTDMSWEWEYVLTVWRPREGPCGRVLFMPQRDDEGARLRAIGEVDEFGVAHVPLKGGVFVRGVRLVCEYTRSAKSMREAMMWKHEGRPRPPFG